MARRGTLTTPMAGQSPVRGRGQKLTDGGAFFVVRPLDRFQILGIDFQHCQIVMLS